MEDYENWLSVQQILDCDSGFCEGGNMDDAFFYLQSHFAMRAYDYPYHQTYAVKGECKYDESKTTSAKVKSYAKAESGDVEMMKRALSH